MKKQVFIIGMMMALLTSPQLQAQSCCCTDCICPAGAQGPAGPQGVQGPIGIAGGTGAQGIDGPAGSSGIQGPIGDQGPCCPLTGTFANVFSELDQLDRPSGSVALMEGANASTPGIDISNAGTSGAIVVTIAGIYKISWNASGQITPPYPTPVPSWSMALNLDGVPITGSGSASFLSSPNDLISSLGQTVIIFIAAGQTLTLSNTSTVPIDLQSTPLGITIPVSSVSMTLSLLTAL